MQRMILILIVLLLRLFPGYSQNVHIPDAAFLHALIQEGIDSNGDGQICHEEAEIITCLDIAGDWDAGLRGQIKNMIGIEAFRNLDTLRCQYNQISSLDFSFRNNFCICCRIFWI